MTVEESKVLPVIYIDNRRVILPEHSALLLDDTISDIERRHSRPYRDMECSRKTFRLDTRSIAHEGCTYDIFDDDRNILKWHFKVLKKVLGESGVRLIYELHLAEDDEEEARIAFVTVRFTAENEVGGSTRTSEVSLFAQWGEGNTKRTGIAVCEKDEADLPRSFSVNVVIRSWPRDLRALLPSLPSPNFYDSKSRKMRVARRTAVINSLNPVFFRISVVLAVDPGMKGHLDLDPGYRI